MTFPGIGEVPGAIHTKIKTKDSTVFKKASRKRIKLKTAITGPAGSGKTTSGIRLARGLAGPNGKVALIDTENGSASLYSDRYDFDVCEITPPFDHQKFIEAIMAAVDAGYDVVIIDSASHFWEGILEYKDKLDRRGGNSFMNWNEAGRQFKGILNSVLQSPIHVICCLRSKIDYVIEQDGKGKATPKKVGLAPIMRDGVEYEFTTVFDVDLSHNAATSKDRTGLFTDKIFQITEQTGEELAKWLESAEELPAKPAEPAKPVGPEVVYDSEHAPAPHLVELVEVIRQGGWDHDQLTRWKLGNLDSLSPENAAKAVAFLKGKLESTEG
jgi:hypothetical protein